MAQSQPITKQQKKERIPYWVKAVSVFFLGWVFMYATRTILNPVMGDIQNEFSLSDANLGLISSMFFLVYAAFQIPSGLLGDKIGKKRVLVPGFIIFGIFAAVTGTTNSFFLFLMAWMVVGAGEGTFYGPQYALSSEAIPKKRITLGSAIINAGMAFGMSLGYYISTYTVHEWGMHWRTPFFIIAVPVVLVGLLMAWVIKEKPDYVKEAEAKSKAEAIANGTDEKFKFTSLFKNRNLLMAYITIFCSIYGFFMILTWLPFYLETERGVTGGSIALMSSLVPWAAIPGSLLFSWISDKMGRRRPITLVMLPIAFLATISVVYFDSIAVLAAALLIYGIVGKLSLNPILVAVVADNAPKAAYSTAFSVYNFIGMTSSILAPYITGYLSDLTGSLETGFYVAAALLVVGFIAMLFLKEDKPETAAA